MTASKYTPSPRLSALVRPVRHGTSSLFAEIGRAALFVGKTTYLLPKTVRLYRQQTLKTMNSMAWGRGSLTVDGGVVSLMLLLGFSVGIAIAIQAYDALNLLGFGALSGIIGSFANIREIAPILTGIGFAAQAGCRMTAEIGAMRISEEIDATEVLGLQAIPFVVGTRLIGGMLCVIPSYLLALVVSFVTGATVIKVFRGEAPGTYDHYFSQFLDVREVSFSLLKALVFCIAVTFVHCYFGYFAQGGPAGVGSASGRAIRMSLILIVSLNFLLSVAIWGLSPAMEFRG
ncbi:MlaE family ABC transporter permease [Nocardia africana]|uniref:Probable phospholipid ABC transporter permease protein mlaE n=1 Tax=Nocardia africana TaxID=134964 RepID=A0A378X074_9NOCA|nr:ABC transporter permease [Nocardia africana]MCC3312275.1 ABC transporter permease [Nocardia africana]SUA46417.1 Probable phospholipid ABC transporter permease protein mlaE [Nocardia africana]